MDAACLYRSLLKHSVVAQCHGSCQAVVAFLSYLHWYSFVLSFAEGFVNDTLQVFRRIRHMFRQRRWLVFQDRLDEIVDIIASGGCASASRRDDTQAEDVTARINRHTARLLRRHVFD